MHTRCSNILTFLCIVTVGNVAINPTPLRIVNDVIADKNVVSKIMSNSTGLQHIGFNGFAKLHWQTGYYPVVYGWCLGLC